MDAVLPSFTLTHTHSLFQRHVADGWLRYTPLQYTMGRRRGRRRCCPRNTYEYRLPRVSLHDGDVAELSLQRLLRRTLSSLSICLAGSSCAPNTLTPWISRLRKTKILAEAQSAQTLKINTNKSFLQ
ncbi:hypothetical protein E2C01_072335 [Portunus trituberculatus]|uniref:Uncharacterized protein n=1 Tax=Portunus trituberculatus TaxID=210409 RepID=A0A5B7I7F4_PORTR|nr:hypothetical protein [Portunus trituberculatus]